MRIAVFLEFQYADEREGFSELAHKQNAHHAPELADVAVSSPPIARRNDLGIKRQRDHTLQLVLSRYLRETRTHTLYFPWTASLTAIGAAEETPNAVLTGLPRYRTCYCTTTAPQSF